MSSRASRDGAVEFLLLEQAELSAVLRVQDLATRRPRSSAKGLLRFVRWSEETSSLLLELVCGHRDPWGCVSGPAATAISVAVIAPGGEDESPFCYYTARGDAVADAVAQHVVADVNATIAASPRPPQLLTVVTKVTRSFGAALAARDIAPCDSSSRLTLAAQRSHLVGVVAPALRTRTRAIDAALSLLALACASQRWPIVAAPLPPPLDAAAGAPGGRACVDAQACAALVRSLPSLAYLAAQPPRSEEGGSAPLEALSLAALRLLYWLADPDHRRPKLRALRRDEAEWHGGGAERLQPLHVQRRVHEFAIDHPTDAPAYGARAASHGTIRAFHGTPLECAHAITQLGLRNMSGTDGQTTGAVHGEGVYLGMRKHVASSFAPVSAASALGAAWPGAALRGADLTVVFAADVVDDASFRQATISIRDEDGGSARDSYLVVRDAARNVRVQRLFLGAALPRAAGRGRSAPDGAARGTSAANSGGSTALAQREGAAGTQRAPARAGAGAGAPGNRVKRLVRWIALFVLTTGGAVAVLLIALLAV